eukprot:2861726-Pleurochrysis_carterae.AAC.8
MASSPTAERSSGGHLSLASASATLRPTPPQLSCTRPGVELPRTSDVDAAGEATTSTAALPATTTRPAKRKSSSEWPTEASE